MSFIHVDDFFHFENVSEMTATSNLVVVGTIASIEPGRAFGEETPKDPAHRIDPNECIVAKVIDVRVGQVLHNNDGQDVVAEDVITLDEMGWWADGMVPMVFEGYPELCEGDEALLFLTEAVLHVGRFAFISQQGIYRIRGSEILDTQREDELSREVEELSVDGVIERVSAASMDAKAGRIEPLEGPSLRPDRPLVSPSP